MTRTHTLHRTGIVVALLLLQFFIRTHQIEIADAYIDEAYHLTRAAVVWDFDVNPGRFSAGKLLVYYWLGIFEADPVVALPMGRLAIAIASLLNGATLYLLGRLLVNHRTGVVALALYAILPFTVFFDRMAMADPFAAIFSALVMWRSVVFARHPGLRQGVILGVLLGLASLAKLTMALLPVLVIVAALLDYPWQGGTLWPQIRRWMRAYLPGLILAALMVGVIWSPILVPAYLTRNDDQPFRLVDRDNIESDEERRPDEYLWEVLPLLEEYTSRALLVGVVVALGFWLGAAAYDPVQFRHALLVLCWLLALTLLILARATLVTSRYFIPAVGPALLALAYWITRLWGPSWPRRLAGGVMIAAVGVWAVAFALPFIRTALTAPRDLPLTSTNWTEFQAGYLVSDDPTYEAAELLNRLPPAEHSYGTDRICYLLYFFAEPELTCLGRNNARSDLSEHLNAELEPCGFAYVVIRGYPDALRYIDGIAWQRLGQFESEEINRPVTVWRATWEDRCVIVTGS